MGRGGAQLCTELQQEELRRLPALEARAVSVLPDVYCIRSICRTGLSAVAEGEDTMPGTCHGGESVFLLFEVAKSLAALLWLPWACLILLRRP